MRVPITNDDGAIGVGVNIVFFLLFRLVIRHGRIKNIWFVIFDVDPIGQLSKVNAKCLFVEFDPSSG